ncbi:MAG: hypothetical protein H6832_10230 [Planctomycetes bacterium]|nr:hypothetical protein [Planctomycetota bacterium]MCB9918766.1 hypothetical protein [Planctomycetota bacterium]
MQRVASFVLHCFALLALALLMPGWLMAVAPSSVLSWGPKCPPIPAPVPRVQGGPVTFDLGGLWTLRALEGSRSGQPLATGDDARRAREAWVPAAFEHELGADFDGVVEYERVLRLALPPQGHTHRLRFAGVMTHARVLFNGRELGEHLGGWTPFAFELPRDSYRDGAEQSIRVVVDERVGHATQGFLPDIAPHFGGIWQDVTIELLPAVHLRGDRTEVTTSVRGGIASVTVRLHGRAGTLEGLDVDVAMHAISPGDPRSTTRIGAPLELSGRAQRTDGEDVVIEHTAQVVTWSPEAPQCYRTMVTLRRGDRELDQIVRTTAFCEIAADGRQILVDGRPRTVRGVLHWGYAPPFHAPNPPESYWLEELRFAKAAGFDTIKACLWLPPPRFFELALQEGLFVWVEYPAWHPDFSAKNREPLLREYREFFEADRVWPHVIARSLTCETGQSSDAGVVEALFDECKRTTGGVLVEDDSSWISWNRFHDFYDDHPYGNPSDWVARLEGFDHYIEEHGAKPFLLGEAITGDTWIDFARLDQRLAGGSADGREARRSEDPVRSGADSAVAQRDASAPWWRPLAVDSMRVFERDLEAAHGTEAVRRLVEDSMRQAMRLRKYEIEAFRRVLPTAGYVVSVMRDFPRARMGFFDDCGAPKWTSDDFAWHGASMLVLDDPRAVRSIARGEIERFRPVVRTAVEGAVETLADVHAIDIVVEPSRDRGARSERLQPVESSPMVGLDAASSMNRPIRLHVRASSGELANSWSFWACPTPANTSVPEGVRIRKGLDLATLEWVEGGGALLLVPGSGAPRSRGLWFLEGAGFGATQHPLFTRVPREMLYELQAFDLHGPVFDDTELVRAFDCVLGYWDTHDERESMKRHGLLLEARVGKGRILACALSLDLAPERAFGVAEDTASTDPNPARAWLRASLLAHLAEGPQPRETLGEAIRARIRASLTRETVELDGTWRLKKDERRVGTSERWFEDALDAEGWIDSRAGAHWEAAGLPHYTGQAWYRRDFVPPPSWKPGQPLWLVCDGVDDSYEVFVNGESIASHGDEATGTTVWLIRTSTDIGKAVRPGTNQLALRVVDHVGAGGLHRPVRIQTSRPEAIELLQR